MNYIEQATRTESVDLFKVDSPRLLHAAIGAMTEASELLLADDDAINVKEEMGDILWYIAIACATEGWTFEQLILQADVQRCEEDPLQAMLGGAADALDVVKRGLFYGIPTDREKFMVHFGTLLLSIQYLAQDCSWKIEDLQEANIAKLTTRFPDKFTSEAAVERDIEAEREALS